MTASDKRQVTSDKCGGRKTLVAWLLILACPLFLVPCHEAEAAVSKGNRQQLEAGGTSQGGGATSSSEFRQQATFGEAVASTRISSARFKIIPGFLGASGTASPSVPVIDLDLSVLYAKTAPMGVTISAMSWQTDRDPIFIWEPPNATTLAGYSYEIDATPDDTVDTTATSFDVAVSSLKTLADGQHVFTVKALNSAGNAGKAVSFTLWIDTTPPQISTYTPAPGALLNEAPSVSATVTDGASGVTTTTLSLLVNGSSTALSFDPQTGTLTANGGRWQEGLNSCELRAADLVGNAQTPLVWSVTLDTTPPSGALLINAGSEVTTSVYVTLGLAASDATSGIARMLISNEELAGYVEEPYVAIRELWKLPSVRGWQRVYVKFMDAAGNVSAPVSDDIELGLLAPETVITSGPAGLTPNRSATFAFMCPEGDCLFAVAFDNEDWSSWEATTSVTRPDLGFGNHYFRVKAAKEVNGTPDIQPDEEDPSPAERTWVIGVEAPLLTIPKGPPIKVWRLE